MSNEPGDLDRRGAASGSSGPSIKLIALLLVVVALGIFVVQNGDDAPVSFLWFDAQWPVWLVILVSVVAGVVLDRLGSWQWRRARRRKQVED
jgi:uncharacterized integral membrane protein